MNRFSPQGGCQPRFRCFPVVLVLLIIPAALFVLAACSPEAGNKEFAITGVSFEEAPAADSLYLGFFPQQKLIILTKTDDTAPDTVTVQFELPPKTILLINDEVIEGSTYVFDLEYSEKFYLVTLRKEDGTEKDYRLNLYAEAEVISVSSDYEDITTIDTTNQSIAIEYDDAATKENVVLSFNLSPGASLSLDHRLIDDPSAVNIPLDLDYTMLSKTVAVLIQSADKQDSTDYQIVLNYKSFFSFSTGREVNDTHPDVHFLVGYLELKEEAANAVAYTVALPSTETAPVDFAALKSKANTITHYPASYSIEKDKPQWFPLLDLAANTEHKIYIGVEYDGGSHDNLASPVTQSTVDYNHQQWGILGIRDVTVYLGQSFILPGILRIDNSIFYPNWSQRTPSISIFSEKYTALGSFQGSTEHEVLGETDFSQTHVFQYHLKVPSAGEKGNFTYRLSNLPYAPNFMEGTLLVKD